uniref:Uncharacterized protein n=1 Tax=Nelumbo nucifera TaxID=4432 RepID=A0A822ZWV1_NELNU|nr:TPA_asm: hypothetical protein HUJ06_017752 [Nelumbo nucifera]
MESKSRKPMEEMVSQCLRHPVRHEGGLGGVLLKKEGPVMAGAHVITTWTGWFLEGAKQVAAGCRGGRIAVATAFVGKMNGGCRTGPTCPGPPEAGMRGRCGRSPDRMGCTAREARGRGSSGLLDTRAGTCVGGVSRCIGGGWGRSVVSPSLISIFFSVGVGVVAWVFWRGTRQAAGSKGGGVAFPPPIRGMRLRRLDHRNTRGTTRGGHQ